MFKCTRCDQSFDKLKCLALHAKRKHNVNIRQLYIEVVCDGVEPTCACGCKEPVTFYTLNAGFATYKRGHVQRVKNNWGHNAACLHKSQNVRREMHKQGKIKVWNRGESLNSDPRLASLGKKCSETIRSNPIELKNRSVRMRENRLSGVIKTLTGSLHSQWKGGSSNIQPLARSNLHKPWTYPKLKASNFMCQRCGSSLKLEVHHNGERFAEILQKAIFEFGGYDDSFERKELISKWVVDYHVNNDVSGIVLCEECHHKEHARAIF